MREAIINLSDDELAAIGYGGLVSLCREAGLKSVELLEDEGTQSVPQIEVETRLDETQLDEFDCVNDWELVSAGEGSYVYVIEVEALELPEEAAIDHADLIGMCDPTVVDRGLLLSLVGSQETIRNVLRNFEEAGVVPELHRLGDYEGGEQTLEALTDRQLEVLQTAYELGFYAVPREATIDDVASALGIDGGTVSEHLQRAERNVLSQQLTAKE
ncbi:helix-turn-helix domain-containing protein [Halostella sp. JP-L12]|uniref:helix-turn-helix domain-containing protein n=1 Tax=Halostella TaxID=1843185 RepID=UPI000EF81D19|nr:MULTISPECIES: helix-turn-helix domain-containing protein [Halostella]NHN49297.1 helix-turn-helix domain-containing protein [Halostella sp. JP-L12]